MRMGRRYEVDRSAGVVVALISLFIASFCNVALGDDVTPPRRGLAAATPAAGNAASNSSGSGSAGRAIFNVMDNGAVADGETDNVEVCNLDSNANTGLSFNCMSVFD